jgi:hypothetical protein
MTGHFATPSMKICHLLAVLARHTDEHRLAPSDMWGNGSEIFPVYLAAISSSRRRLYEPEASRDWRQPAKTR